MLKLGISVGIFAVSLASAQAEGLSLRPLRVVQPGSTVLVSAEIPVFGRTETTTFQGGQATPMFDMKKPLCDVSGLSRDDFHDVLWKEFKIQSIEGASVFPGIGDLTFSTTLKLADPKNGVFFDIRCERPFDEFFTEINITEFEGIFGKYLRFNNVTLSNDQTDQWRPVKLSPKFALNELEIRVEKDLTMGIGDTKDYAIVTLEKGKLKPEPDYGGEMSCSFLMQFPKDKKDFKPDLKIPAGTVFKPISGDIGYTSGEQDYLNQNFYVILRMDKDNTRMIRCENNSRLRIFDYQDFWDATGKNNPAGDFVSWTMKI